MKRALILSAACAVLAAPVQAQDRRDQARGEDRGRSAPAWANPSAVIAAELAFAHDAQVRGQWRAFSAAAAPDAVMFAPGLVWVQQWLKGRADPPAALSWQPYEVWSSCDGTLVASHGAWHGPKGVGWFTTLWARQPDGGYKWVFDHGDALAKALPEPEMIAAHVADCPARAGRVAGNPGGDAHGRGRAGKPPAEKPVRIRDLPPLDPTHRSGASRDGTLHWEVSAEPGGRHTLIVTWSKDGATVPILSEHAG